MFMAFLVMLTFGLGTASVLLFMGVASKQLLSRWRPGALTRVGRAKRLLGWTLLLLAALAQSAGEGRARSGGRHRELMLWGFVATALMTTILHGSQGLGLSRLSLSFLVGTFFTGRRDAANVIGFFVYMLGGWLFAIGYFAVFSSIGRGNWWIGLLLGVTHAIVLLVAVLPLLPYLHSRMVSEYDGPSRGQRLEPPGFVGLHYGYSLLLVGTRTCLTEASMNCPQQLAIQHELHQLTWPWTHGGVAFHVPAVEWVLLLNGL